MSPTEKFRKTRDPREPAVYPITRERNQALQDLVESLEKARARTYAACAEMTLIVLRELREDLADDMKLHSWSESFDNAVDVLEGLIRLLKKVDAAEEAEDAG